ncbi:hypothetical protein YC2023_124455 [Brassica napus]
MNFRGWLSNEEDEDVRELIWILGGTQARERERKKKIGRPRLEFPLFDPMVHMPLSLMANWSRDILVSIVMTKQCRFYRDKPTFCLNQVSSFPRIISNWLE